MFGWIKRGESPGTCRANPGQHLKISFAFTNGEKTWEEAADIMTCMAEVLKLAGQRFSSHKSWLELDSGIIVQPRFVSLQPIHSGGVQTLTTVEVSHGAEIPAGVFEFQHSTGNTIEDSIKKGFDGWTKADLPVFADALQKTPQWCTLLEIEPSAGCASMPGKRRVVLGPVSHLVSRPVESKEEEHPFCPCCLFTKTGAIWKDKLADSAFYGVRLFAMRNGDGKPGADCRINGEDWEAGKAALTEYVQSWPDRGVEFRKQYVIIQNHSS